ncbi:putative ABC transporter [Emiliania huxleyi CCMP1516]|uniref:ABC transporter n=2 Tax=Emiliania huxleyi TaxID=2903 RepID=A0A0D3KT00_EMIH1|nr:putative ABC transporter [Emiliania huxleyi CCMP1516]EOD38885.1 putative ABC transporter [Emiliania huxleyi CCMP1516]|eukprot:XP_005791314.1 putative ABC transporter [Emiliania huxleyi CCMP1516]
MPRKSRRTVQRADPALDRRTWRPATGRAATASEAEGEASAAARKTPKKGKEPKIGLLQLLHFATPLDYLCLSIAVPCAAGTGFLQVSILFIFGALLDSLGSTSAGRRVCWCPKPSRSEAGQIRCGITVLRQSMKVKIVIVIITALVRKSWEMPLWFWFVLLGLGQWILCTVYNGLTDTAKERMIARHARWGTSAGEGLKTIEEALSPKAVILFEWLAMAVTGWALCFKYEWRVALIILACSPLVLLGGALMGYAQQNGQKSVVDGYAEAGAIATEVLGAVRTVASLGLETLSASRYDAALHKAQRAGIKAPLPVSLLVGLGMAILFSAPNVMMGAGLIYGTSLLKDARTERQMQHSFLVRTAGGFNTTLQLCAKPCDEYNLATANADYNTTLALYNHNTLSPATPRSCADFGAKVLTWTCFTADLTVSSGLFDADAWATLSFSSSDSSPLTFLEVPGQPALLDDASFRSYFEQQTGGWTCAVLPAAVLLAIFALQNGAQGLGNVGQPVNIIAKGRQAGVAILQTIRRVPAIDSFSTAGTTLDSVTGAIEVVDVVFAYPTRPDFTICHGYSLSIGAGQTVALCGPSGSGKSTLVALLERFYDPQRGAITLDGVDIRTLNLRWLRSQLGLVGQEPVLFEGTVAENIGYGKEGASQDEIEEAARAANAHGFVMDSLPDGYATQVGLRGGMLSGGQKQRVAIARAIVRKPAVLLLDEATSALDNESERVVQAALDSIVSQHKRTTVTIAHRLSTIKNADKIAVLRKGAVIEQGSHEELLELGGTYLALWEAQQ